MTDDDSPRRGKLLRPAVILAGTVVFVVVAVVAIINVPQWLLNNWLSGQALDAATVRLAIGAAAQTVLFALGGVIALVGVALSLSRHSLELQSANRDQEKEQRRIAELEQQRRTEAESELRARFVNSVALLSDSEKPTTRFAGLYALAALADDWMAFGREDETQVCIDVICSYLRSPWDPAAISAGDEKNIRSTGFNIIGAHLRQHLGASWHGRRFNFVGALIDFDIAWASVDIADTNIDFGDAKFSGGNVGFAEANFSGGTVGFFWAKFNGATVLFRGAKFNGGNVIFDGSIFSGGTVSFFRAKFNGGNVTFDGAEFNEGKGNVNYFLAEFNGGRVTFNAAEFNGVIINIDGAKFNGGTVNDSGAKFNGGSVRFDGAKFNGGTVTFDRAKLKYEAVIFNVVEYNTGTVSFRDIERIETRDGASFEPPSFAITD